MSEPTDSLRLFEVEQQLDRLRQVVASVTGGLSHFVEHPEDLPQLDLSAACEVLRTAYRGDLTGSMAMGLSQRLLFRTDKAEPRCPGIEARS